MSEKKKTTRKASKKPNKLLAAVQKATSRNASSREIDGETNAAKKGAHRQRAKKTKESVIAPVGRDRIMPNLTSIEVANLKTLWELGLPVREIQSRTKLSRNVIYHVVEHYHFTPRKKGNPVVDIPEHEIEYLEQQWKLGTRAQIIAEHLNWTTSKVYRTVNSYGFKRPEGNPLANHLPKQPVEPVHIEVFDDIRTPDDIKENLLTRDEILKAQLKHVDYHEDGRKRLADQYTQITRDHEKLYRMENLKDLRNAEFKRQLATTDIMRKLAFETLDVMGTTAGEIEAFADEDSLLKKAQIVKTCVELLKAEMETRAKVIHLHEETELKNVNIFDIDFMAAARQGGLKATAIHPKDDIEDAEFTN